MAISRRKLIYPIVVVLIFLMTLVIAILFIQLKDLETLKKMVAAEIKAKTQREVDIGTAQLDLSEGIGLQLGKVTLKRSTEQESDFSVHSVLVVLEPLPLLNGEINIQKIILDRLQVQATRTEKGVFNFGNLAPAGSGAPGVTFADLLKAGLMHSIQIRKSELWLVDHYMASGTGPLVSKLTDLTLIISKPLIEESLRVHIQGRVPFGSDQNGTLKLDAKIGVPSDWSNLSKVPLEGEIEISNVGTQPFQPYLAKIFAQHPGDHLVSLTTRFDGTLDGHVHLSGTLKHALQKPTVIQTKPDIPSPLEGSLNFNLAFMQDNVEFKKLSYGAGDFLISVKGSYARFMSDKPWLSLSLKSTPFEIQNSQAYLPFKVFSKETYQKVFRLVEKGEIEFVSLGIEGPPELFEGRPFQEIEKDDTASIIVRNADFVPEVFPFKSVTGEFHFQNGVASLKVHSARFDHILIKNMSGNITTPLTDPRVEGTFEVEGAWAPFLHIVEKRGILPRNFTVFKEMHRIQGRGRGIISVKGPLFKKEELRWAGEVTIERAGFRMKGWSLPIQNLNGVLHFKCEPAFSGLRGKRVAKADWTLRLEHFSGELGKHLFREVHAESMMLNGLPMKTIRGTLQFGELNAEDVISTPFEGRIKSFVKNIIFQSGVADFTFQYIGIGPGNKQPQNQGTLDIKKLFLRHKQGFRPLNNLSAKVSFDDHDINFETWEGWYGDSPLKIKGRFKNYSQPKPELTLMAGSDEFLRQDFAGIPFLETLEYRGPAKVKLNIHSTSRMIKLDQAIDLTRASYRYGDLLIKPENISNSITLSAALKPKGHVEVKRLEFELEGNRIIGKGFVHSIDDPQFAVELTADHFKAWPSSQYIRSLEGAMGGDIRFHIAADGNLSHLEEVEFQGTANLKGLEFKPENLLVPIRVSMNLEFKNRLFKIDKGKLELKDDSLYFGGTCRIGKEPHIKLQLVGGGLDLNQVIREKADPSKGFLQWLGGTHLFASGSGEIGIKLSRFNYKFWKLPEVSGLFTFKDQVIDTQNMTLGRPGINHMEIIGKLFLIDSHNPAFDAVLVSRNTQIQNFFDLFGDMFNSALSGKTLWMKAHLKGRGGDMDQISQSLQGRFSFDIQGGRIHTGKLLNGLTQLFDMRVNPETFNKRKSGGSSSYLQVFGNFSILNGVAHTDNFMFEDKGDRLSLVGDFDLHARSMEATVGVAPFRRVGRVLEDIPLLGSIVTGGGSLLTTYYKVKGPFSNPEVESVPLTSLSKKVVGTIEGIFKAPSDLFPKQEPSTTQ